MGFIKDNTNVFEVYLTDLGKEKFFNGGLKDAITHFSICDDDSNYTAFLPNSEEVLEYAIGSTYQVNDVVEYSSLFYKCKKEVTTTIYPTTGTTYWDKINLFNPTVISQQPIPVLNHFGTNKTSMGNYFLNEVFIQVPLRGKICDNIEYQRALFGVKTDTQRNYVLYEPAIDLNQTLGTLSYIIRP